MPRISQQKKDKIAEQVLHHLFATAPSAQFTNAISKEIARDEEFIKSILLELKQKNLVIEVKKNSNGIDYLKRQRWLLSQDAFNAYQKHQEKSFRF